MVAPFTPDGMFRPKKELASSKELQANMMTTEANTTVPMARASMECLVFPRLAGELGSEEPVGP